ncbi:MAG: ATP-binding cassette domain-containing protein [Tissierellia bacterium]|nr:ATP-binding cassette domain-containing protein [Tissierellia bacterium]
MQIDFLQVNYRGKPALTIDTPITFQKNDRIGVIGSNGAGKTTLVKALLGLIPSEGRFDLEFDPREISVHLQFNEYQDCLPIRMIMELILDSKLEQHPLAMELIDYFDFRHCLNKKYSKMSGGERQKLTLILVLAEDNPLVFFDEVTTGLDFTTRMDLIKLMSKWYQERDTTLFFITHYYKEIENIVNKLLILDRGRVLAWGDTQALFRKYCGESLIILNNKVEYKKLFKDFSLLDTAEDKVVLSPTEDEVHEVLKILEDHRLEYVRSRMDLEVLVEVIMAKEGSRNE